MSKPPYFLINLPVKKNFVSLASFLEKLGFIHKPAFEANTAVYSDGQLYLQLVQEDEWRGGVVFLTDQALDGLAARLQSARIQTIVQDNKICQFAPDGTAVYWLNTIKFSNYINMDAEMQLSESLCGRFYELSLEVEDLQANRMFWETLGFEKIMPEGDANAWLTLSKGGLNISLYTKGICSHPFRSPALTWFNTDAAERINRLKGMGFSFVWEDKAEHSCSENAILESPEGQHFFLFKAW